MTLRNLMAPARLVHSACLKRGYDIGLAANAGGWLEYEFPNYELGEEAYQAVRNIFQAIGDAREAHWRRIDGTLPADECFSASQLRLRQIRQAIELADIAIPAASQLGYRVTVTTWEEREARGDPPYSGIVEVKRYKRSVPRNSG